MPRHKAVVEGMPRGRQAQVAHLAAEGCRDAEIAERLGISASTVEAYFGRALREAEVKTRTQLVAVILRKRIARLKVVAKERKERIEALEEEVERLKGGRS